MERLNRIELQEIAARRDEACVSLYMPVHPGTPEVRQDAPRLGNLLSSAEAQLRARGAATDVLGPVRALADDSEFYRRPGRGVAIFADCQGMREIRTQWPVDEQAIVNGRFHIKPLLAATHDQPFYLVAMSKQRVRVFAGHHGRLTEVEPLGLPKRGLDDVPSSRADRSDVQLHTSHPRRGQTREAMFHGQRDHGRYMQEIVARLCRATAEAVRGAMSDTGAPVVAYTDERMAAALERDGGLPLVGYVEGNPDELDEETLLRRAWPVVERHLDAKEQERAERLENALHHALAADELSAILTAAHDGNIDTLFVDPEATAWGRFRPGERDVVTHDRPERDDEDLLDLAAALTLTHGGEVVGRVPPNMQVRPKAGRPKAAAILRHRP